MEVKTKIAVVDDCKITCELISWTLKNQLNCEVKTYSLAEDFLVDDIFSPDMMIVDYYLNENSFIMTGLELITNYSIPTIVISGQNDLEKAIELLQNGANDYLEKDDSMLENIMSSTLSIINHIKEKKEIEQLKSKQKDEMIRVAAILSAFILVLFLSTI